MMADLVDQHVTDDPFQAFAALVCIWGHPLGAPGAARVESERPARGRTSQGNYSLAPGAPNGDPYRVRSSNQPPGCLPFAALAAPYFMFFLKYL
jgi:hypothetical protein